MADGPDPRVDDLREELRRLGYLNAPVDRFVLGGTAVSARPAVLAAAASARIGVLAGVLLGPAAAIGLKARLPGLVTGAADALALAGYLAILFGVSAAVVAFVAILTTGQTVRRSIDSSSAASRARRAATVAGLVVAAGCLTYLTLWWRAAISSSDSSGLGITSAAIAVAAAISLLLGHAVTVTVLAYLARARHATAAPAGGLPLSSWKAIVAIGAVAFAGAMGLLLATSHTVATGADVPTLTVLSTGQQVEVIAIDGVDPASVERLRAAGRLPVLSRLLGQGVATLTPSPDRDPAKVWTTIATGQPPDRHGIRGLESRQIAGLEGQFHAESPWSSALTTATDLLRLTRPAIASGEQRLIPAFWEVAARAGLRTAVVHWWATWPAPQDLGVVISDRAILRLEAGGSLDGEIAPASLYPALAQAWPDRRARVAALVTRSLPSDVSADVRAVFERAATLDATLIELATDPLIGPLDLRVLYLPGLDIVQHSLFGAAEAGALAPSSAAERLRALDEYYAFVDDALSNFVEGTLADHHLIVLVTQPGRVSAPTAGTLAIVGGAGSTARPNEPITAVAPTVLYALGVPIARDLASKAAMDLFVPAFTAAHPAREVSTYGSRRVSQQTNEGHALDREMIERMRALGYIR